MSDLENKEVEKQEPVVEIKEDLIEFEGEEEAAKEEVEQEQSGQEKPGYIDSLEAWTAAGRDPKKFRTKEQFDEYGSLLSRLKATEEKLDKANKAFEAMGDMYSRIESKSYAQAKKDLEYQLQQAIELGDSNAVAQVNDQLTDIKVKENQQAQQQQNNLMQKTITDFTNKNSDWYNANNPELVRKAHELVQEYAHLYPTLPIEIGFKKVEEEIRRNHLNQGPRPIAPSISRSTSAEGKATSSATAIKLDNKHLDEFHMLKDMNSKWGIKYTKEDFVKFLRKDGRL